MENKIFLNFALIYKINFFNFNFNIQIHLDHTSTKNALLIDGEMDNLNLCPGTIVKVSYSIIQNHI